MLSNSESDSIEQVPENYSTVKYQAEEINVWGAYDEGMNPN